VELTHLRRATAFEGTKPAFSVFRQGRLRIENGEELKKLHEYQQHAAECRDMAAHTPSLTHRQQLENMAATWDQLADARRRKLEKLGKTQEDPD
jgi:hypothetical protein